MKRYFFVLLILFLTITPASAQQDLQKLQIRDFSGGMNSFDLADLLPDKQSASSVNVVLNRYGRLSTRKGQALFNKDVGSTAFRGIGRYDPDRTTSYLIAASGIDILSSLSTDTSWEVTNNASPVTSGQDTEFVQANDLLFVLNGFDSTSWWNGSVFVKPGINAYPSSPPSATTGEWSLNYLFLAGATTQTDWVYFSNNLEPLVFDATDIIKINTGDGQAIQKLIKYRINEIVIYKERSIYILDLTGSTPLSDWTVQPISTTIGTPAPRSVVSLGNDQWFMSSEPVGIRSLVRSQFDKILVDTVSRSVQDIFEGTNEYGFSLNKTHMSKACAVLYDNKYIIAIPTGTSTVNNTVLVHDFMTEAWYIIKGWFPSSWIEFDNRLFYTDANDGRILEVFTGTTGDYAMGPETSAAAPTNSIEFVYQSKVLDFDNPENYKQLDAIEVEFNPTGNWEAILWTNLDFNGWASAGTVNLAGNTLTLPFTLPSAFNNAGMARKTFQFDVDDEFKKMQVMVTQDVLGQTVDLQRITIFARPKPWRREE